MAERIEEYRERRSFDRTPEPRGGARRSHAVGTAPRWVRGPASATADHPALRSLPNLVVIGAMKCGTTALHRCLADHPEIAMAKQKELDFFFGPADPLEHSPSGPNWYRGLEWYTDQFDSAAAVRGESSPGYTSPDHPEVAARMAAVVPSARLIYLVRDPVARAVSQYWHHLADGEETRPCAEALLDPASQYISRGLYWERLAPFLEHYPPAQICVVSQEQLLVTPKRVLRRIFRFLEVDDTYWSESFQSLCNSTAAVEVDLDGPVRARLAEALRNDADRLRSVAGQNFLEWSI